MYCEDTDDIRQSDELLRWFIRRLDELDVGVDDETLSYDCNTAYDYMFFRLQAEAQSYWETEHGHVPTPGELTKAFFGAEYERARRDRLAKSSWVAKFSDYWSRKGRVRAAR
ncbi:MAG: hypothetical protein U1E83_11760 [Methylotetracoccus sp.]